MAGTGGDDAADFLGAFRPDDGVGRHHAAISFAASVLGARCCSSAEPRSEPLVQLGDGFLYAGTASRSEKTFGSLVAWRWGDHAGSIWHTLSHGSAEGRF